MPDYRRWYQPGGTSFFTVVTCQRIHLFTSATARSLLGGVMRDVAVEWPFETVAIALLPDHLHCIWTLPAGDADYSSRWQAIKTRFTAAWVAAGGEEAPVTPEQRRRGHRGVWQRRYWERLIRDDEELKGLMDYIHYNPVKHGHVRRPADWQWSSFHRWVEAGEYEPEWGSAAAPRLPAGIPEPE